MRSNQGFKLKCLYCLGEHEPDPKDAYVDFGGKRFIRPFLCLCCGKEICGSQFAYGRYCGTCDTGACQRGNKSFSLNKVHAIFDVKGYAEKQIDLNKIPRGVSPLIKWLADERSQ